MNCFCGHPASRHYSKLGEAKHIGDAPCRHCPCKEYAEKPETEESEKWPCKFVESVAAVCKNKECKPQDEPKEECLECITLNYGEGCKSDCTHACHQESETEVSGGNEQLKEMLSLAIRLKEVAGKIREETAVELKDVIDDIQFLKSLEK